MRIFTSLAARLIQRYIVMGHTRHAYIITFALMKAVSIYQNVCLGCRGAHLDDIQVGGSSAAHIDSDGVHQGALPIHIRPMQTFQKQ